MRDHFLPFHLPVIDDTDIQAVTDVLRSGWLTTGAQAQAFEADFRDRIGCRHALAVNSCTAALHLALEAVGVQAGDEVVVPTMTFAATAEVVTYFHAQPVFADCDPGTLNVTPETVAAVIGPRTRAIVPVHFAGHPCDMDGLRTIATSRGLALVEDAAHALPAAYKGRRIGTIGDITCFSFYATKTITTGEGGMLTTDDDALAERMRLMSLHGISREGWTRYTAQGSWRYDVLSPGFKYNLTDVAAALGRTQLARCDVFHARRVAIAQRYAEAFGSLEALELPAASPDVEHAWHLYVVRVRPGHLTIGRDDIIEALRERGIGTSVHFIPLHMQSYYRTSCGMAPEDLPHAHAVSSRILSLPIYPRMTDKDVDDVIEAVTDIVTTHRAVRVTSAAAEHPQAALADAS
jgi:dTDP-4-amino-4,6-dideoxygalactose transaminase